MKPRTAYIPQQQFHLLIHFKGDQRSVAVLPSQVGQFLVVVRITFVESLSVIRSRLSQGAIIDHTRLEFAQRSCLSTLSRRRLPDL